MMKHTVILSATLLLAACGQKGSAEKQAVTKEGLIAEVKALEDSLKSTSYDAMATTGSKVSINYADRCLAVYRNFPKSEEAPAYLDKAHIILSSASLHGSAVMFADTLIRKYPRYRNRPMVLQSLASSYDLFIVPRKKDKVKYYYELLLKENKGLSEEEKENIRFRLEHVDLTFDQLVELQQKTVEK